MSTLAQLLDLQSIHDNLRTIARDLSAFPEDLAQVDAELKGLNRKLEMATKALDEARTREAALAKDLQAAQKAEDNAKASSKSAINKVQFTSAMRDLEERERQKAAVARPHREIQTRRIALEAEVQALQDLQTKAQAQFDELHQVFLSEHENQVVARGTLETRLSEAESKLEASELTRFKRLLDHRQGRAVVPVDGGACSGCRTRLRTPFLYQLREAVTLPCESCQRILYDPAKQ